MKEKDVITAVANHDLRRADDSEGHRGAVLMDLSRVEKRSSRVAVEGSEPRSHVTPGQLFILFIF